MPRISVVIPHYNDLPALARCLQALTAQTLSRDAYEIIVADNASPVERAALEDVVGAHARLVIVPERGAGPARNGGVAVATGEVLAFIDADCVAEPGWLAEGERALATHDFVGGRVTVFVDDPARMTAVEAFERVFAFDFADYILRKGFTGSGNMFVPRTLFDRVGGFRTGVSEDVEWSQRARSLGLSLGYAPRAVVAHPARRSWRDLMIKWRRTNREMYLHAAEQPRGRLHWGLRMAAMPGSALAHTPRVLRSDQLPDGRARLLALATLYRLRLWRFGDGFRLLLTGGRR